MVGMNTSLKEIINKCDTIFFDLDGTLIDTEPLYFRFWKEATKFYGRELTDSEALSMRSRDKESAKAFFLEIGNGQLNYDLVKAKRIELMSAYLKDHPIGVKEGVLEYLTKLNKQGKSLYIVTANTVEKACKIHESVGLTHLFKGVISAKDVARGKPFPDVYLKACEVVNKKPEQVIVFEDSPNGLMSSYSAGCFTVMVEDMSKYNNEEYVDAYISSFNELL